jgi:hypothetical protein
VKIFDVNFLLFTSPYYEQGWQRSYGGVAIKTSDGLTGLGEGMLPSTCRPSARRLPDCEAAPDRPTRGAYSSPHAKAPFDL